MLSIQNRFSDVHDYLVSSFEVVSKCSAVRDSWIREEGGGGESCVFEESSILERGGINFSAVHGSCLPSSATNARKHLEGQQFFATGVSLVMHPWNPYVPTAHMNIRFFCTCPKSISWADFELETINDSDFTWWIGGGMDMTPYYGFVEDAKYFHTTCKDVLQPFGEDLYPKFKRNCDEYFFLKHRQEARGIGGIFFDDFNSIALETSVDLLEAIAKGFFRAYSTIIKRRADFAYSNRERNFQLYRRGRYVEFNLLWDRGTAFGLQSGGRTESILVSMPPLASWSYNKTVLPNSPEEELYSIFLKPRDWID